MSKKNYDPKKAHDYYERTKHLKGQTGSPGPPKAGVGSRIVDSNAPNSTVHVPSARTRKQVASSAAITSAKERVGRLQLAVKKLEGALSEARAALSKKRTTATKTAKKNSDGKSTQAEKTASKKFRDKHKAELASKRKATSSKGGSSTSSTSSTSSMSSTELKARIIKIESALSDAKHQLSSAQQQLGQLAHSAITSEPTFQEHFARFLSAERRPSA